MLHSSLLPNQGGETLKSVRACFLVNLLFNMYGAFGIVGQFCVPFLFNIDHGSRI